MYVSNSRAESTSWKSRKTSASSYNKFMPRIILQKDGWGRINGPSRNWSIENSKNDAIEAYIPLSKPQYPMRVSTWITGRTLVVCHDPLRGHPEWWQHMPTLRGQGQGQLTLRVYRKTYGGRCDQTPTQSVPENSGRTPHWYPRSLGMARSWCRVRFCRPGSGLRL